MLPRRARPVNPCLALALLLGCAPQDPAASARRPVSRQLGPGRAALDDGQRVQHGLDEALRLGHLPPPSYPLHLSELGDAPPPPPDQSVMSGLGPDLTGLEVDMDRGSALAEYVDENVSSGRWRTYGVAALTYEEIWGESGDDGLCEEGALLDSFEDEDGAAWEASYAMGQYGHLLDDPETLYEELGGDCTDALLAAAGDVEAALEDGCDEYQEHSFFPEGSACRSCLGETAGDFTACVDSGDCEEEAITSAWTLEDGEKVWWRAALAYAWACAPDLPIPLYIMAEIEDDGTLPDPFDHAGWAYFCVPYWEESAGEPSYQCSAGTDGWALGHTLGEGAVGRVNYIRPEGADDEPHFDRVWYAHSMKIKGGPTVQSFWATAPGSAQISMPLDAIRSGEPDLAVGESAYRPGAVGRWGLNPLELRPDGQDATELDDTFARDWLATLTLKTATTIDGIYIQTYNHNRCADGGWEGPLEDGSWVCTTLKPPEIGWADDVPVGSWADLDTPGDWSTQDFNQHLFFPMATLGSTGLPDSHVEGGAVVMVAGTENLADEDWDSCTWPDLFTPDHAVYEALPGDWGGAGYLLGDTYRFDKHKDLDLRVVLNTNQRRGYRPEED